MAAIVCLKQKFNHIFHYKYNTDQYLGKQTGKIFNKAKLCIYWEINWIKLHKQENSRQGGSFNIGQ
jgi:hypothetical protein